MNEKVLAMARELCITRAYLFDIAIEMAEEELGEGLYDEWKMGSLWPYMG